MSGRGGERGDDRDVDSDGGAAYELALHPAAYEDTFPQGCEWTGLWLGSSVEYVLSQSCVDVLQGRVGRHRVSHRVVRLPMERAP